MSIQGNGSFATPTPNGSITNGSIALRSSKIFIIVWVALPSIPLAVQEPLLLIEVFFANIEGGHGRKFPAQIFAVRSKLW